MLMRRLSLEDRYFRELMEADKVVRPALIRQWCREDPLMGERLALMFNEFMRQETNSVATTQAQKVAV